MNPKGTLWDCVDWKGAPKRIKTSVDTGHRAAHDRDYFNWNNEQACNLNGGTFNKYHNQITWWCSFAEVVVDV